MNATLRPKTPATRPPSAAPTASIAPHSEPNKMLALACSSGDLARLGIAACAAGPTNAARAEIVHSPMYPIQSVPSESTSSNASAANVWIDGHHHDHELAVVAIGDGPGDRRHQEGRQRLRHEHERDEDRRIAHVLHDTDERHVHEPVADVRDDQCDEQPPQVAVGAQQGPHAPAVLAHRGCTPPRGRPRRLSYNSVPSRAYIAPVTDAEIVRAASDFSTGSGATTERLADRFGVDVAAMTERLMALEAEGRLLSVARWGDNPGMGEHYWVRPGEAADYLSADRYEEFRTARSIARHLEGLPARHQR